MQQKPLSGNMKHEYSKKREKKKKKQLKNREKCYIPFKLIFSKVKKLI